MFERTKYAMELVKNQFHILKENVKGQTGMDMISKVIFGIVGIMVVFLLVANLYPEVASAGDDLNSSGFPLGKLFVGGGLVFLLMAIGILIFAVKGGLGITGSKK